MNRRRAILAGAQGLGLCAVSLLCHAVAREAVWTVWTLYAAAFAAYLLTLRVAEPADLRWLLGCAVATQLAVWPAVPELSDDVVRFAWDARTWASGHNPFAARPSDWVRSAGLAGLPFDGRELYPELVSRDWFASYPPFVHTLLWVTGKLASPHLYAETLVLKGLLLVPLFAVFGLLPRVLVAHGLPADRSLWFVLHPLVPIELAANAHWEAPMILGVLGTLWAVHRGRPVAAGLCLAFAVSVKLVPLVLLPWVMRRLGPKGGLGAALLVLACNGAMYAVMLPGPELRTHYLLGLSNFFGAFHFNASVAYAVIWPLYALTGDHHVDEIGRLLGLAVCLGACVLAYRATHPSPEVALWTWTLFLAGSLVVHPWYLAVPLALGCFTPHRFVVVWTALIPLTYSAYATVPAQEWPSVVVIEYGAVLAWLVARDWRR